MTTTNISNFMTFGLVGLAAIVLAAITMADDDVDHGHNDTDSNHSYESGDDDDIKYDMEEEEPPVRPSKVVLNKRANKRSARNNKK